MHCDLIIASPGKYGFWKAQWLSLCFLYKNNVKHVIKNSYVLSELKNINLEFWTLFLAELRNWPIEDDFY